jgi:hypothetical protein
MPAAGRRRSVRRVDHDDGQLALGRREGGRIRRSAAENEQVGIGAHAGAARLAAEGGMCAIPRGRDGFQGERGER